MLTYLFGGFTLAGAFCLAFAYIFLGATPEVSRAATILWVALWLTVLTSVLQH